MISVLPSKERHFVDRGWVRGYFAFSFADYYDEDNNQFGKLLVFNEETLKPSKGFREHPNFDIEIVTYVLQGKLQHKDNLGNKYILEEGDIHVLSAGTGINHSTYNASDDSEAKFLQFWILPDEEELSPSCNYLKRKEIEEKSKNNLLKVISSNSEDGLLKINQNLDFTFSMLDSGNQISYKSSEDRKLFVYLKKGKLSINSGEYLMQEGDSLKVTNIRNLEIEAGEDSEFIILDMK